MIMISITFLIAWIMLWITHELMHCIEYYRQGVDYATIKLEFWRGWIPTMRVNYSGILTNKKLADLSGGLYCGILSLTLGLYAAYTPSMDDLNIEAAFIIIGVLQLIYGLFEMKYLSSIPLHTYMKWHYVLYAAVLIPMILIYIFWRIL